jgi:hypothetical protein
VIESSPEPCWAFRSSRSTIEHLKPLPPVCFGIVFLGFCLLVVVPPARSQTESQPLSPSEALRWAMDPFNQARSQNGDLTDADKLALSLGESRAAHDCLSLTATPPTSPLDPTETLAFGKLCLFGQQFEPARATLVRYLDLPSPPERETALILMARAFLGLKSPASAAIQVLSLFRDYPYDAEIHSTADQAISGCEYTNKMSDSYATQLCAKQKEITLPLLQSGKGLQGKDQTIPPARLFADALRCSQHGLDMDNRSADPSLAELEKVTQQPSWQGTADLLQMQEAMARAEMTGQPVPLPILHARQIRANQPILPRTLALRHGEVVLAFFTLWSPSAISVIQDLADAAPSANIYAVTSWRANTGDDDRPSPAVVSALRILSQNLPRKVPLLVVPDGELNAFHLDQYPAGVAIDEGIVISDVVLADAGSLRMALYGIHPAPAVQKQAPSR